MSLPSGISTCVVTFGRATSYLGNDATISGTLSADRTVVHAASGVRVGSGDDVVPNEAGFLSFAVPHVDQAGFIDGSGGDTVGWLYILTGSIQYASGKIEGFRRTFSVLVGQTSVDLDLLPDGPVLPSFTAPSAVVTSVNGETGAVTVDGASDDAIAALVADDASDTRAALGEAFVRFVEGGTAETARPDAGMVIWVQDEQPDNMTGPDIWVVNGEVTPPDEEEPSGTVLFADDFNRADAGTLGNGWTTITGTFSISGNKAVATTGADNDIAVHDVGADDVDLTVVGAGGITGSVGPGILVAASSDAQSGYLVAGNTDHFDLFKRVGGSYSSLAVSSGGTGFVSTSQTVRVLKVGANIKVYLDAAEVINHTDAGTVLTGTHVGLRMSGTGSGVAWDNLEVKVP